MKKLLFVFLITFLLFVSAHEKVNDYENQEYDDQEYDDEESQPNSNTQENERTEDYDDQEYENQDNEKQEYDSQEEPKQDASTKMGIYLQSAKTNQKSKQETVATQSTPVGETNIMYTA